MMEAAYNGRETTWRSNRDSAAYLQRMLQGIFLNA